MEGVVGTSGRNRIDQLLSVYYFNTPGVCTNLGHPTQDLIEVIFGTPYWEFETFILIIWMNNL